MIMIIVHCSFASSGGHSCETVTFNKYHRIVEYFVKKIITFPQLPLKLNIF